MNTKLLMSLSALFMAALGVLASFFPQEIAVHLGTPPDSHVALIIQIGGKAVLIGESTVVGGPWQLPSLCRGGNHSAQSVAQRIESK
jgi:hypothetical protein